MNLGESSTYFGHYADPIYRCRPFEVLEGRLIAMNSAGRRIELLSCFTELNITNIEAKLRKIKDNRIQFRMDAGYMNCRMEDENLIVLKPLQIKSFYGPGCMLEIIS